MISSSSSSPPTSDPQNNAGTTSASMVMSTARKTRRRTPPLEKALLPRPSSIGGHRGRRGGVGVGEAGARGSSITILHILQQRSEVNRKNKGVQKIFHCAGTQTFADIRKTELQKSGQDMDRSELFIVTHTRKDGIPVNSECAVAIEKIQALKQSQSSANSSQTVASKYDIYSQVLGEDKPGRVRGLGTGPTPATLWGRSTDILKDENKKLGDRVKDLEERIAKLEKTDSKFQEENDSVDGGVASKESASVTKQDAHSVSV
ncbi:hypothetical protein Taro_003824 [Colocasia esculenta]|uniref:Uncharacterized protein n=1 Tax=Colocasia esculenta TaxID=4460 RepID=A0A843TIB3_COLES|nr:hypothetical protein [Colocasia esculenta]